MKLSFAIVYCLIFATGIAKAADSFLLKENYSVPKNEVCVDYLNQLSNLLYGKKDQDRDLALISRLICSQQLLKVEVLFEAETEDLQERVQEKIQFLVNETFMGRKIPIQAIEGFFWSFYDFHQILNQNAEWVDIYGFEAPAYADRFLQIWKQKLLMNQMLLQQDLSDYHLWALSKLSLEDQEVFENEIWEQTQKILIRLYSYYKLNKGQIIKSGVIYELSRIK